MTTILLAEDDEHLSNAIELALNKRGFDVLCAHDCAGVKAILASDERRQSIVGAILDLKLGQESSLDIIPLLCERVPNASILMLTGYASIATAVEAVKLGATNYLPKPSSIDEMLKALELTGELTGGKAKTPKNDDDEISSPRRLEWEHIQRVLLKHDGNISATARELNMHRRTLQRKLQKYPVKR